MLSDYQRYRLYEILPGLSIWVTLVAGILCSFLFPLGVIYAIIIFDVYWVLRVVYFSFYLDSHFAPTCLLTWLGLPTTKYSGVPFPFSHFLKIRIFCCINKKINLIPKFP